MLSCVILWKGFVEMSAAGGADGAGAAGAAGALSDADGGDDGGSDGCVIILKYGFLLSGSVGGEVMTVGGGEVVDTVGGGGLGLRSSS